MKHGNRIWVDDRIFRTCDGHFPQKRIVQIAKHYIKKQTFNKTKQCVMVIGAPGSGKSLFIHTLNPYKFFRLDRDSIMEDLPEYIHGTNIKVSGTNVSVGNENMFLRCIDNVHDIFDEVLYQVRKKRGSICIELPMYEHQRMINFIADGYNVNIIYIITSPSKIKNTIDSRAMASGRFIGQHTIDSIKANIKETAYGLTSFALTYANSLAVCYNDPSVRLKKEYVNYMTPFMYNKKIQQLGFKPYQVDLNEIPVKTLLNLLEYY